MRTVSTAYSGTPSARARICSRSSLWEPGHEAVEQLASSPTPRAGRAESDVKLRCPAPQLGRCSRSSGRARHENEDRARLRDHSSRYSTNSSERRVGPLHVLEHENDGSVFGQPLEEERARRRTARRSSRGLLLLEPEQVSEQRLDEAPLVVVERCARVSVARASTRAVAASSSSAMPARIRTISASAQ